MQDCKPKDKLGYRRIRLAVAAIERGAKLMGIDGANNFAAELVAQAVEELAYFDAARAAPLYYLANYIANRQT